MRMPSVKLNKKYVKRIWIFCVLAAIAFLVSLFVPLIQNGFSLNIFCERDIWFNIILIILTILLGFFTYFGSKVMASVQVDLYAFIPFDLLRHKHTITEKIVDIPISITNRHGMPVRINTKAILKFIDKNKEEQVFPFESEHIHRGEENYFLLGGCSFAGHIQFDKNQCKIVDNDLKDNTELLIEAHYENQYTYIEKIVYKWKWDKNRVSFVPEHGTLMRATGTWIFEIPRDF